MGKQWAVSRGVTVTKTRSDEKESSNIRPDRNTCEKKTNFVKENIGLHTKGKDSLGISQERDEGRNTDREMGFQGEWYH
ncbi:MAG: hypothetical protein AYK19_07510 [Theionarchaea archaeon DG-70-1]|nr:MAG: hypothetical protein AYK19_07510 [Theionarchaea archaeon DG-70-1]